MPDLGLPKAWSDLMTALPILARERTDDVSPFNCSHDQLSVMSDPSKYTAEERAHLDELGFHSDGESFYSFRYGSA